MYWPFPWSGGRDHRAVISLKDSSSFSWPQRHLSLVGSSFFSFGSSSFSFGSSSCDLARALVIWLTGQRIKGQGIAFSSPINQPNHPPQATNPISSSLKQPTQPSSPSSSNQPIHPRALRHLRSAHASVSMPRHPRSGTRLSSRPPSSTHDVRLRSSVLRFCRIQCCVLKPRSGGAGSSEASTEVTHADACSGF